MGRLVPIQRVVSLFSFPFPCAFLLPFPRAASSACRTEHGDFARLWNVYTKTGLFLPLRLTFQPRVPVFGFSPATWTAKGPLSAPNLRPGRVLHQLQARMTSCGRTHDVETRQFESKKASQGRTGFDLDWSVVAWLFSSRAALPALCICKRNAIID
jgi:hypothetical protein